MAELYAACWQEGQFVVKRVLLARQVRNQVGELFEAQEREFLRGIDDRIQFTGEWRPEPNELLVLAQPAEAQIVIDAVSRNPIALPNIDAANFADEGIVSLFTAFPQGGGHRVVFQAFTRQQVLSRKFTVLFDGQVFNRVSSPVFSLGDRIVAMLDPAGNLLFKSFSIVRKIFDIAHVYRAATDVELGEFCNNAKLAVEDAAAFISMADEGIRKAVFALARAEVLENHEVAEIRTQARSIGFRISIRRGRLVVPQDRKSAKELLSFLLDKVYRGAINQQLFITNSHRPL
ncbi:hypothetical protein [Dongia sp. agr-C8]